MTPRSKRNIVGGLLALGLGLPGHSQAITGCNNSYLNGVYGAQISSVNLLSATSGSNAGSGTSAGTDSGASTTAGASNAAATPFWANGFGSPQASLGESGAARGRFFFDGQGNIVGRRPLSADGTSLIQDAIGSYTVNTDCTARINLTAGQAYDAIVVKGGDQALFVQTSTAGGGTTGSLLRSQTTCTQSDVPASFGFRFFGLTQASSVGSGSNALPYSAIGVINLDGAGNFTMTQSLYTNSSFRRQTSSGTYTVDAECGISLSFTPPAGTGTGGSGSPAFVPPSAFRGMVIKSGIGLLSLQPDQNNLLTGEFFPQ